MITLECPHCGKEHILLPEEVKELLIHGKVVITSCKCGRIYTVEQGDDCYFTK